jgi:hypothetical protein
MEKLYIRPADMPQKRNMLNPKTFLTALYAPEDHGYPKPFPATYTARNFHERTKQCEEGKSRSFGELLAIVNSYFEDVTPQEVLRIIYSIIGIKKKGNMLIYCPDVKKIVLHCSGWDRVRNTDHSDYIKVLVDYLFFDYGYYVIRNSELYYEDEYDFITLMSYIGITEKRCIDILVDAQNTYIENRGDDYDPEEDENFNSWTE